MKKQLSALFLAGAAATLTLNASAADVGIGVALSTTRLSDLAANSTSAIYVPIELNDQMRLEPFIGRFDIDEGGPKTSRTDIGAGFFGKMKRSPNVQMYYGGRLAIVMGEIGGVDNNGMRIEPAAGLEYSFDKKFSVAGEVAVFVEDLDVVDTSGTKTQIMLRYYF